MEHRIIYTGFAERDCLLEFLRWKGIDFNYDDVELDWVKYGQDLAIRIEHGDYAGGNPLRTYTGKDKYSDYGFVNVMGLMSAKKRGETAYRVADKTPETKPSFMNKIFEALQYGFMSEPEKTYRKLGLIDSNNIITTEGTKVLLTYMLKNGSTEGFDEYAKGLLKETDK